MGRFRHYAVYWQDVLMVIASKKDYGERSPNARTKDKAIRGLVVTLQRYQTSGSST